MVSDDDLTQLDDPKKSRARNPPYSIQIEIEQYRRNREYTGEVEVSEQL